MNDETKTVDATKIADTPAAKAARKAEQERDGQDAMREYQAELQMTREKTARLRALRLEKEAAATTVPRSKTKKASG